jgi:hypothetical protein
MCADIHLDLSHVENIYLFFFLFFFFAGSSYGNCLIDDEHINIFFFTPGKAAFTSMSFS